MVKAFLLTNIDALAQVFVRKFFVKQYRISLISLKKQIQLQLADNFLKNNITYMTQLNILLSDHRKQL